MNDYAPIHGRSCDAPLAKSEFQRPVEDCCKYCTDEHGVVKSCDEIRVGIRRWMLGAWRLTADGSTPERRREDYMNAMPRGAQ